MSNRIDKLKLGKQYRFTFTHKKNIRGLVCEIDVKRNRFVIYDLISKEYEAIPDHRFVNAEIE